MQQAERLQNVLEIQHYVVNHGVKVWKKVRTLHFPGKYFTKFPSSFFFFNFIRKEIARNPNVIIIIAMEF